MPVVQTNKTTVDWRPNETKPAVTPTLATTEALQEQQHLRTIDGVARMKGMLEKGIIEQEAYETCLEINSEKLGISRESLATQADQIFEKETSGTEKLS